MSCWSPWPRTTRKTTQGSGLRSHKSNVTVEVRLVSSVGDEWPSREPHRCSQLVSDCFYSHRVWRQADRWNWDVHFTKLSKFLSSPNYLSLVDPGTVSWKTKNIHDWYLDALTLSFNLSWSVSWRCLLERLWRWRSRSSSCLSMSRKWFRTVPKTMWRSMEKSKPLKKQSAFTATRNNPIRIMSEQTGGRADVIDGVSYQSECVEKGLMGRWRKPAPPTQWKWSSSPTLPSWTEDLRQSLRPSMPAIVSDSLAAANVLSEAGIWSPVIHSLSQQVPVQKSALYQIWAQMRRLGRLRRHERWIKLQWVPFTPTADFFFFFFRDPLQLNTLLNFLSYPECNSKDISCKNGLCKPMFWKCDGVNDCGDNTDEQDCGEALWNWSRKY